MRIFRRPPRPIAEQPVQFCLDNRFACNEKSDNGHHCNLPKDHPETFHVCPCYWRWPR